VGTEETWEEGVDIFEFIEWTEDAGEDIVIMFDEDIGRLPRIPGGRGPVTALNMLAILPCREGEDAKLPNARDAIPAGIPPTVGMPGGAAGMLPTFGKEKETA